MSAQQEWRNLHNRTTMALYPWSDNSALTAVSLVSASASSVTMPRTVRPRRQRPDNQANIAILNERIATLEAELCAEQRRSAYDRADFDRERSPTGSGNTPIVELGALRTLLEEVSRPGRAAAALVAISSSRVTSSARGAGSRDFAVDENGVRHPPLGSGGLFVTA